MKTLYRATNGKMLCGVCAGLAEYFQLDVSLIRLVTVISACCGFGFIAYIAAALIVPEKPAAL